MHAIGCAFAARHSSRPFSGLPFPKLAVVLYPGIAIYLVVPFRDVTRLTFRRS